MKWYVAHTRPRQEAIAREHLDRQGFATYLPLYRKRRSHARRIEEVPAPVFPGYMFVSFDIDEPAWNVIRSTRGMIDLVRNGIHPVAVMSQIISEIKERESDDGFVLLGRHLKLSKGDAFRIERGPFAALHAIFEEQRDDNRVIALLSLLGREVTVQVPISAVAPLS